MNRTLETLRKANVSIMLDALSKIDTKSLTADEMEKLTAALEQMCLSCMDIIVKYGGYSTEAGALIGGMMQLLSDLAKDDQ